MFFFPQKLEKSEFMLLLLVMEFCFKKSKSMDVMETHRR